LSEVRVTLLADKDERFKNLFGKAMLFILFAVVGISLALLWTGINKGAFSHQSSIYFVADSGQDLNVGMPVKLSGFKIGKLSRLTLDEHGEVQVETSIETKYLKLIRQDATVSLKKEGVIGDGILEFSRGSESKPILKSGGKVAFERASGLEQAVLEVKERIMPIIDEFKVILVDPQGDVRQTLKNLHEIAVGLRETQQRLNQVLGSVDSNLNNELQPLLHSLRQSAANAETISLNLDRNLPSLLSKTDSSLENIRLATDSLNQAVQQTAPQLPGMISEARDTLGKTREMVGSTQEVVDGLTTSWPLNRSVPALETTPIKVDSHD